MFFVISVLSSLFSQELGVLDHCLHRWISLWLSRWRRRTRRPQHRLHRRCRAPVPASRTASERETASGGLPITILVTHILDISDDSNFEKEALQYVWVMPWLKNASLNAALQNGAIWFYRLPCSPNIFIHWHCQTAILKQKQHVQAQTCCQESVGLRPKQVRKVLLPHHIQCQQYAIICQIYPRQPCEGQRSQATA